jgi:hypothetical protein
LDELEPLIHQPVQTYRNGGSYVIGAKGKKIRLSSAGNHSATLAGRVYYEQLLSVKPPERYSYNQSLIQDKWILGRKGERIQVRRRGADGVYKILPAGVDFFKFHASFWTPLFPRLIRSKKKDGSFEVVEARSGWDYVPLANLHVDIRDTSSDGWRPEQTGLRH